MKLLLLGSGGREHALAWKIAQSPKVEKLYIAPGNAGTSEVGENVAMKADDFDAIAAFVLKNQVDIVVVGPEDPLVKGIVDYFKANEAVRVFVASDIDTFLYQKVTRACAEVGVPVIKVDSAKELGRVCSLTIGCAAAAVCK